MPYLKIMEKIFPEISEKIKSLSIHIRLFIVFSLFCITAFFSTFNITQILGKNINDIIIILSTTLLIIILLYLLLTLIKIIKTKQQLIKLVKKWKEYQEFWFIFQIKIESCLRNDKELVFKTIHEEEINLKKYHQLRSEIRELIFLIDENNLIIKQIQTWDSLCENSKLLNKNQYQTPFSLLVDFENPIYAINNYGEELWHALQISSEFIEYLTYKNHFLKKYWQKKSIK